MIILKEFNKITKLLEDQTTMQVASISVDLEDEEFVMWVTIYDKYTDTSYDVCVEEKVNILTQFQNERILKSLTNRLIKEWTTLALDVMVVH